MEKISLKERLHKPIKQWIKAIVWSIIYILFIVWVGTYWWLILLPLIIDAFVARYIPWTWWKKSTNKTVLTIMGWVDAIVFALVAVYFINTYLFQNYQIPSSSLEKSLLVGDFLFVSKASFGPRVPMTPLSFPLVQHTFPVLNCKSFIEHPQWNYKRLKGFDQIKRYDIVVFNFPGGDSVLLSNQLEDFEKICYRVGYNQFEANGLLKDLAKLRPYDARNTVLSVGHHTVMNTPEQYGKIVYRPVDRRENYVKRCVGLPGEFIRIKDRELYIDGVHIQRPAGAQHFCYIETTEPFTQMVFDKLKLSKENTANSLQGQTQENRYVYVLALTQADQTTIRSFSYVKKLKEVNLNEIYQANGDTTFPVGYNQKWTVDNYGPIWIPKAGKTLKLNINNLPIYQRIIQIYEHNKLEVKGNTIIINDKPTDRYTFKMNYYWMMGDNRHLSADSRIWGFVPEDHIVGRPVLVWLSLDKDKGWFSGKIRWERFFKNAER